MLKELISTLSKEKSVREAYEEIIIGWFRQGLKPEGQPYYDDFVAKLQKGEEIFLPDYNNMLLGFDQESGIMGLESMEGLEGKPILALANHTSNNGPLGGGWKIVTLSYHIYKESGNKIRPMHGYDPTARHDLFRERLNKSIGSILIRDPDSSRGASSLRQAISNRDSMCLYPEGGFGQRDKKLRKGMSIAGKLIRMCLKRDYTLITVSLRFQKNTFFAVFDRIDSEEIARIHGNKDTLDQNVVDCAMKKIALHLPLDQQGYYNR